jgi:Dolichyl-phosphate-mannose-protein mannosyltransferase
MSSPSANSNRPYRAPSGQSIYLWIIAGLTAALHLAVAGRYDLFRNELYFIVCGRHPAFGYFDQPPLVPLLAAATQLWGIHVWLLRLPAAAAAAALVLVTAAFARLWTSRTEAIVAAALAAAIAPGLSALTSTLTTSTFEPLAWTATAYFLARGLMRNDPRAPLWAGLVAGIALQTKYGITMWLLGLGIGLALTSARRILLWKSLWLGVALTAVIALPSVIWQATHDWPFLALIAHHRAIGFDLTGTPLTFEIGQILAMNVLLFPLWGAGIVATFCVEDLRPFRFLSIAVLIATAVDIGSGGKDYYLFAAYPTLFAVGARTLERLNRWLIVGWLAGAVALYVIALPLVLPVLDPPVLARYMARTHLKPRPEEIAAIGAPLTQVFSDELGWRELEQQVGSIYHSLPTSEQRAAAIFAGNYGEAAAIDFYGRADGLPPVISGANQYFIWGPGDFDGSTMIVVGGTAARWSRLCQNLERAGTFGVPYAMPYERDRPIMVCRGLRVTLPRVWPRFERFD